jgi:hypothetical protein
MNAQDTANNILVDFNAESQRYLLGDSGTTPVGITALHFNYGVDEFSIRSFRARLTPALGRKQAVFSLRQHAVEIEQRGRLQDDCTTQTRAGFMKRTHKPANETLGGAEAGSAIENQ